MTETKCKGGTIYRIGLSEIHYIGYFYGANGGRESLKDAYLRIGQARGGTPDFLFNCELFDFSSRRPASDVVENGRTHRLTEGFGLAFVDHKRPVFSYKNNVSAPDYVGFYPTLIRGGKLDVQTAPAGLAGARGRTALGTDTAGNLYLALIPDRGGGATLAETARALMAAGAKNGGNLDGGASTQWYTPTGCHSTGRALRGFIALWLAAPPCLGTKTVQVKTALNIRRDPPNSLGVNLSRVVGVYHSGDTVRVYEARAGWWRTERGWCYGAYLK